MARRSTYWTDATYHAGAYQPIKPLLAAGSHRIEAWGNSKEGWQAFLTSGPEFNIGLPISPLFTREQGDRLMDLKAAAGRCYGIDPKSVVRGRNFP